jgi:succinoglycan biosynthesis transport protein ExoP
VGVGTPTAQDWIVPAGEDRGFARYLSVVWGGKWIVLVALVAALAGAGVYLARAQKVYEAHAQLLVTPLSGSSSLPGLGLIAQSADPLRDVETAAGFVNSTSVAQRVITSLHLRQSAQGLLREIHVAPIAESDIVDIAADAPSPGAAAQLATAFANQTVVDRSAVLNSQLNLLIPRLQAEISALGAHNPTLKASLSGQLAQAEALRAGGDPNLTMNAQAVPPAGPSSPRKTLTLAAAVVGGLVAGIGLVLLIQLLRPRIRREEELRERFRLPILARVPRMGPRWGKRHSRGPFAPDAVPPEGIDAFRALRTVLVAGRETPGRGRIVLVTGGSPLDGKSTTAINLSAALASSGDRVILVEGDSRRPSIGAALNLEGSSKGLVTMNADMPQLRMLLATANGSSSPDRSPSTWHRLLLAARRSADWVVVDAPPLIYAPDVLSAADLFDDVLLAVRLGNTDARNLDETAEMLAHNGIRPVGLVVVGTSGHREYY